MQAEDVSTIRLRLMQQRLKDDQHPIKTTDQDPLSLGRDVLLVLSIEEVFLVQILHLSNILFSFSFIPNSTSLKLSAMYLLLVLLLLPKPIPLPFSFPFISLSAKTLSLLPPSPSPFIPHLPYPQSGNSTMLDSEVNVIF